MFLRCRRYSVLIFSIISFIAGMIISFFLPSFALLALIFLLVAVVFFLVSSCSRF